MGKIKVIKNKEKPESTPVLADAILKISDALLELSKTDLNERAIIVLTQDACENIVPTGSYGKRKPNKKEIQAVLDSLKRLKSWYCKN